MIRGIIRKVTLIQNAFPADHGVSDTISPRNIIDNLPNLDYHSIKVPFGAYAQVALDEEVTNTQRARTVGCIVLDPVGLNQKYRFMSLETGRRVSGRLVKVLPVTEEVIARVNHLGSEQQQPTIHNGELLFEWRPGHAFEYDGFFDGLWGDEYDADREAEFHPEPVVDGGFDDAFVPADDDPLAHEVTEDDNDNGDYVESQSSSSEDVVEDENDEEDDVEESDDDVDDDISYDVETNSHGDNAGLSFDNDESVSSEPFEQGLIVDSSERSSLHTQPRSESNESEDGTPGSDAELPLGRGMRMRVPNPKYYGYFSSL
jgi:hypothetical protein